MDFVKVLCKEFNLEAWQVQAVIELLDGGNTIPFIARYRKEMHGSLDDQVLRDLAERLEYLRGLEKRKGEIEKSMTELGVITDELREKLNNAVTLAALEDIYRPFRPKRRTRATVAKERGLEKMAMWLMLQPPRGNLTATAEKYIDPEKDVPDIEAVLAGARDIIAENVSDNTDLRTRVKDVLRRDAVIKTCAAKEEDSVYRMYYEYEEPVSRMASHRILAVNRGEKEGFLKVELVFPRERAMQLVKRPFVRPGSPATEHVEAACEDAWDRLLFPSLENEIRNELTERANVQAIRVFSQNLHQLLMQPPIKGKVTLGVDPGFRTGCKLAVVDETGKVLDTAVGYFTIPGMENKKREAAVIIKNLVRKYHVTAVAIGNGTASRESEQFIASLLPDLPGVAYMIVSEAGASVYSASKLAAAEFPDFDVTQRSAVSIARRMQDPLAELVKIDPKSIGVGQYQHDLKQNELSEALDGVVEQCVNAVGVEVSTASAELLSHVAGIGPALAKNIVAYREENGIASRAALKKVPKLGPKAYEQCAGFLRVAGAKNPLDATAVHPESYECAEKVLETLDYRMTDLKNGGLPGIKQRAGEYGLEKMADAIGIGVPTLTDIIDELEKPGRDPRDELPKPLLRSDVLDMKDLQPGMELTGTVRNVTDFGAFVDIGVHEDGLVHKTRMASRPVRDPSSVVKVGDIVKVWVLEVDEKKKRISLTMVKS